MKAIRRIFLTISLFTNGIVFAETPLMTASFENNTAEVERLIANNAKVDEIDIHKQTALMYAVVGKSIGAATILLKAGANPNHLNDEKASVLDVAVEIFDKNIFLLLLNSGADINYRMGPNEDHIIEKLAAKHSLSYNEWPELFLRKEVDFYAVTNCEKAKMTLAHCLVAKRDLSFDNFRKMISLGVNPKLKDNSNNTFLHYYSHLQSSSPLCGEVCLKNIDLINELLDMGLDINAKNDEGETPFLNFLSHPSSFKDPQIITFAKKLIENGADPFIVSNSERSVFSFNGYDHTYDGLEVYDMNFLKSIFEKHIFEKNLVAKGQGILFESVVDRGTRDQFNYFSSYVNKIVEVGSIIDEITGMTRRDYGLTSDELIYRISKLISLGASLKDAKYALRNIAIERPEVFLYLIKIGASVKDSYYMKDTLWVLHGQFIGLPNTNPTKYINVVKEIRKAGIYHQDACDEVSGYSRKYGKLFCR